RGAHRDSAGRAARAREREGDGRGDRTAVPERRGTAGGGRRDRRAAPGGGVVQALPQGAGGRADAQTGAGAVPAGLDAERLAGIIRRFHKSMPGIRTERREGGLAMRAGGLFALAVGALLGLGGPQATAGPGWSFGFSVGGPVYARPWGCYHPWGYYYYRPYPV